MKFRGHLLAGVAILASALAAPARAQVTDSADEPADRAEQPQSSNTIVVQAGIGYRNRSDAAEPMLIYDEEYFQRFEPLTAGDALKRVPSVTFLSDVIESDGPRLRGLEPGYTQILINGEKVPGSNADRSFFLDRIPAELIEQVEIVRSSSARRTGDAIAGSINIVLRDAFSLDGGYVKGGALLFDDGEIKPTAGLYYGGAFAGGRILLGANVQGRYNPKEKLSLRYGNSPEHADFDLAGDFDNREDQSDVRDGWDYATNASWAIENETTKFEVGGHFVRTDRTEYERSYEYNDETAVTSPVRAAVPGNLLTDNHNINRINQESWSIDGKLAQEWSFGETSLRGSFARFGNRQYETENEIDFDRSAPRLTADLTIERISDEEMSFQLEHSVPLGMVDLAFGGFWQNKDRRSNIRDNQQGARNRRNLTAADRNAYDQFSADPDTFVTSLGTLGPVPGGRNAIEENRRDLFALVEGELGTIRFETGVRWETTDVHISDATVAPALADTEYDYDVLLPSASVKIDVGAGRITASVARTLRRPQFDFLTPVLLEEELGDNDLLGNPLLRPEKAWGGDLGYEHHLGRNGVIGVNVFYRKVDDLIELATVLDAAGDPVPGSANEDDDDVVAFVLQPVNAGEGEVYGIELDLSTDLAFLGLPETGVFGNVSWLDSTIDDVFGERRFNDQSEYVYNFGVIHNLRQLGAALGATYRKQGSAFGRVISEEVTTTYGADLEVFVEKRFGDSFTIRAVGSNLLDGKKREVFNKFDTIEDQMGRDFDEYELESERAGPVFQLVGRFAF